MKTFANRLKRSREKKKNKDPRWTQSYVADLIGVARPTYTAYENENHPKQPPLETVNKLADYLETSTDYLLGRTDDPSSTRQFSVKELSATYNIVGKEINLTEEELSVLAEMKKHPKFAAMFHDLATNPEKKVKTLIKMWEVIKADLDEDDDRNDIIED